MQILLARHTVLDALAEFDRSYRDAKEWTKWEEHQSHRYAILYEGRKYPVKKVASLASGIPVSNFSGGVDADHANSLLVEAGFSVASLREVNPDWGTDELILALDFYLRHRKNTPSKSSAEIARLSELLQRLGEQLYKPWQRGSTFRNANGVYMKLMNFRRFDPEYTIGGKKGLSAGSDREQQVWDTFARDPNACERAALAIKRTLDASNSTGWRHTYELDEGQEEASEGRLLTRQHLERERNIGLVKRKKQKVLDQCGRLECEVCGFDFLRFYGPRGFGYIECHHTRPVGLLPVDGKTNLRDLALVCANCHRMIHRGSPWLAIDDLKKMLASR